jgi:hypothetical protein
MRHRGKAEKFSCFGRILAASGKDRAFHLYLFCLRQKRIPLQSLARSPGETFSPV